MNIVFHFTFQNTIYLNDNIEKLLLRNIIDIEGKYSPKGESIYKNIKKNIKLMNEYISKYKKNEYSFLIKENKKIFTSFLLLRNKYPNAKFVFRTFNNDIDLIEMLLNIKCIKIKTLWVKNHCLFYDEKNSLININDVIKNNTTPIVIKEDYNNWKNNKKDSTYGIIIKNDKLLKQYCFDYLDRFYTDNKSYFVFKVDVLEAIIDDNYFINKIKV